MRKLSRNTQAQFLSSIIVVCLLNSCSNHQASLHTEMLKSSPPPQREGQSNAQRYKSYFFELIKERIEGTNIKNLKDLELNPSSEEIRIWVSISFSPLQGVILQQLGSEWKASFLPPIKRDSKIIEMARSLPPPKSGWNSFWEKMRELEIYTLPDAQEINVNKIYPDAEATMVEIKTNNTYRTYVYVGYTFSERVEPKKLAEIIDTLSQQFGLKLAAR